MNYFFALSIGIVLLFSACQSPEEKAAEKLKQDSIATVKARSEYKNMVDSAEKIMQADKNYNMKNAMGTLKAYNDFIQKYPIDTMTAEYLFRAADLAQGAKEYQQAADYLENILANHKNYRKYSDACFVAAFVYDTYLEDVNHGGDRAKQLYEFIIEHYPNTSYAEQSKVLITYIGIPDSVMIDEIIKKGGK